MTPTIETYRRLSTEGGTDLGRQDASVRRFPADLGLPATRSFSGEGLAASLRRRSEPPALRERGQFTDVIVEDVDCMTRETFDAVTLLSFFERGGVRLHGLDSGRAPMGQNSHIPVHADRGWRAKLDAFRLRQRKKSRGHG